MYKTRNITDFFKPFAQSPSKKRVREDDRTSPDKVLARERSRSKSPRVSKVEAAASIPFILPSSSLTSILTSVDSNACSEEAATNVPRETIRMPVTASLGTNGSQEPVLTSSQRMMKKGQVMVKNSDDESDSGTSLDDLDDLLNLARQNVNSSPPTETDLLPSISNKQKTLTQENRVTGRTRSGKYKDTAQLPDALPVMPKYKFSLQSLIAQAEEDDAAEASAMHAKEIVDALDEHRAARAAKHGPAEGNYSNGIASGGLLVSVMEKEGESESIDRLVQAIQRTEALHQEKSWSFFTSTKSTSPYKMADFPRSESLGIWHDILNDGTDRQRAFLDGYVEEVAGKGRLPDEIISWIIDATCVEGSEILRDAYVSTLVTAADQVKSLLTPYRIDILFRRLTAHDEAVDLDCPVIPVTQPSTENNSPPRDWSKLISVLKLLAGIAASMTVDARTHALCLLCRLALDASAINDGHVTIAFEDAFANLIDSVDSTQYDHKVVLSTIYPRVADAQLRLQLLRSVPASSIPLNLFRQRLAMAFFYEDSAFLLKQPQDLTVLSEIAKHLRQPQFRIRQDINYSELAASAAILDIGIGDGNPPKSITAVQSEDEFNKEVDRLAKTVKGRFTRIIDSGASHMLRTEAKDVLEALHCRLTFAVRTKQKPKANPFAGPGVEIGQVAESGAFMKAFLAKRKENSQSALGQA